MDIIKIVGSPSETTWSQVHAFLPKDEKEASHGQLLAAMSFKVKAENLEVASFGSEIIQRLQEIYYSNNSETVFKKLSQTLESLEAEFIDKVELEAVMGVVWRWQNKVYLYLARNSHGQVFLFRDNQVLPLFAARQSGREVISGEVNDTDRWLIATASFYKIVAEGEIKAALTGSPAVGGENLGAIIHGHESSSQAAGIIAAGKTETVELVEASVAAPIAEPIKIKKRFLTIPHWQQFIVLRPTARVKKSNLSALIILLLVFGLSLFFSGRKKQQEGRQRNYQAVLEEVNYKYAEAHNLIKLNPLRAKSLLTEGQARLADYEAESKQKLSDELKDLGLKIQTDLGLVQREYRLGSAQEWFDFDLVKDGFRGTDWGLNETAAWVLDEATQTVVEFDLASRKSRVVAEGKTSAGKLVAAVEDKGFVVGPDEIKIIGKSGIASVAGDGWQQISDAIGFGGNLYLLDQSINGQIWKYLGIQSGLSAQREYLKAKNLDLSSAVSLTIDGSVWVLFSDGTIVKYTQGIKEPFTLIGLDKNFQSPTKIFTTPENNNLYILDSKQIRVVVVSKSGEYQAQYIWPGIAGARDLLVSESLKKIFLLTGEKVFTLDLQ